MLINFRLNPFYAPESDTGASGTEEVADLGTDDGADPFAGLSFSNDDEESEEVDETTEEPEVPEEVAEEVKPEVIKEERTSKQPPEVDAAYKRARVAEETAARLERELNEHKERYRQEVEFKSQEQFHAKAKEQWNSDLAFAQQMRDAGYDEQVVSRYLNAQSNALTAQSESQSLQQQFNKFKEENKRDKDEIARIQTEKSASEGREIIFRQRDSLKAKYGDLVPDSNDFSELIQQLGNGVVDLISKNGLDLDKAFRLVNHDKILQREKSLAEKRTTANIVDRGKKTVETNKTEKKPESNLTPGQIRFAKEFGLDPKEVAKRSNPNLFKRNKGVS